MNWVIQYNLPAACKTATALPAATPPPLAIAAVDIMPAAYEPAAIPAEVKPTAPKTTGARHTEPAGPKVKSNTSVKTADNKQSARVGRQLKNRPFLQNPKYVLIL